VPSCQGSFREREQIPIGPENGEFH
jgi:hypothetical protein